MGYYIGLDGGSTYLKAALVGEGRVMDTMVHGTGIDDPISIFASAKNASGCRSKERHYGGNQ